MLVATGATPFFAFISIISQEDCRTGASGDHGGDHNNDVIIIITVKK